MWVRIDRKCHRQRHLFLAACYFPPASSHYAIRGTEDRDPYVDLQDTISQFVALGDIIILRDFNARTTELQTPLFYRSLDPICSTEIDLTSLGLQRHSEDVLGLLSMYGRHLLRFCESSGLVILNGLSCFPGSEFFTCWPHGGGASVDYVLAYPSFISYIHIVTILRLPIANHALLNIHLRLSPHLSPTLSASSFLCHYPLTRSLLFYRR